MKTVKGALSLFSLLMAASVVAADPTPGVSPGAGVKYATDAYPGFDSESEIVSPSRKTPRWFAFIFGPKYEQPAEQFAYCRELLESGDYKKACRQLDALVREWPTSTEAPRAQQLLAETLLTKLLDYEEAFREYRYLLDFHSLQCDYNQIADRLYQVAGLMKAEGKEVMFVRFENTVDVRRAYEATVLHAPGAKWVPEAMLTIAQLREHEEKFAEAVKVYENLRNLYPDAPEAKRSYLLEAQMRRQLIADYGYNRARCQDSVNFCRAALNSCREEDTATIKSIMEEIVALCEQEDYQSAKFYDSNTRTVRSAIGAYEKFLLEHPHGVYADAVRNRLLELKGKQP